MMHPFRLSSVLVFVGGVILDFSILKREGPIGKKGGKRPPIRYYAFMITLIPSL